MVIPIRKIQASELKELVVWWSKQGRGVDPKKLMRVRLEGGWQVQEGEGSISSVNWTWSRAWVSPLHAQPCTQSLQRKWIYKLGANLD